MRGVKAVPRERIGLLLTGYSVGHGDETRTRSTTTTMTSTATAQAFDKLKSCVFTPAARYLLCFFFFFFGFCCLVELEAAVL